MGATDRTITLAGFLKFEAPGGDVRLCDGGFLDYDSERYEALHPVFGSVRALDEFSAAFGDSAEDGGISFVPAPDATVSDWWRTDLGDSRIRFWQGEVSGKTVSSATLLADLLVDTPERTQSEGGDDVLALSLIGRAEKLFLTNEGNVCSERFHKSVWSGEDGFNNCTDDPVPVAWGVEAPSTGTSRGSRGSTVFGLRVEQER